MNLFGKSQSLPDPYANPIDKKRMYLMIGLIGGILLAVIIAFVTLTSSSNKPDFMVLVARESDLLRIAQKVKANVRSDDLNKANTEAILLITSDNSALTSLLRTVYKANSIDGNILVKETDSTAIINMQNAALLNKFDTSWRTLVHSKLTDIVTIAQKIKAEEHNATVRKAVQTAITNAETIDKRMAALNL